MIEGMGERKKLREGGIERPDGIAGKLALPEALE